MPGLRGLLRNLNAAILSPQDWWVARRSIVKRGAIQHVDELAQFSALVRKMQPKRLVEIGTAQGGVFWLLCQLSRQDATLVSVDLPPEKRFSGGLKTAIDLQKMKIPGQAVHAVSGSSHDPAILDRVKAIFAGNQIDVLFIDGDHSYGGVRQDYEMYRSLVRPGGIIAFHDIVHTKFEDCHVDVFWNELVHDAGLRTTEIIGPTPARFGGIGVVTVA
jgi:predicted O-methyltransferase YrrM